MSQNTKLICLLCCLVVLAGCQGQKSEDDSQAAATNLTPELIAVIDLNVVAQEIGAQTKIDLSLKQKEAELLKKFNGLKAELGRRVSDFQAANGDLNDHQQNELDEMATKNQSTLTLQAQAAQSQLLAHHAQLKQKLLAQIRPVAYNVAQEKGMQIVLTVGQVYAAGPNVDITQDVVKRVQAINDSAAEYKIAEEPPTRVAKLPGGGEFMPR